MCTRNIMNSSGGQVGNLSVDGTPLKLNYTYKWCALIWNWCCFSDLILCDKSEKVCLSDSAWKLCNCIMPQCVRRMWIVVIGGKVWCCDIHVLDIWDNFAWLYQLHQCLVQGRDIGGNWQDQCTFNGVLRKVFILLTLMNMTFAWWSFQFHIIFWVSVVKKIWQISDLPPAETF